MSPANAFHEVAIKVFKILYTLMFLSLYHQKDLAYLPKMSAIVSSSVPHPAPMPIMKGIKI